MKNYDHSQVEKKWQKEWEKKKAYRVTTPKSRTSAAKAKKFYGLIEFPFPSGDGLHVGHIRSNTAMDIIGRKRRAEGYNVLYPIGWDAFGLPTEQYAIKTGIHPAKVSVKNTDTFRRQLKSLGFSFDWDREIDTTDPAYYKWTQWIFLQMFKRGVAYQAETTVWWCEGLGTVLANEEVIDGKSERGNFPCIRIPLWQWMLAITKYADRLDKDLDTVNYLEKIKIQQRNWIGKSEGAEITFKIINPKSGNPNQVADAKVFTTRPDTLFGVTYIVLSPELFEKMHASNAAFAEAIKNTSEALDYVKKTKSVSDIDRSSDIREKTGVELKGIVAINPANDTEVPVWIADYVLGDYGTGAVMAVPAHDDRDAQFAQKFGLPSLQVVEPLIVRTTGEDAVRPELSYTERDAVVCIVKHWSEDKYLCSRWKKNDWKGFIIGGIEKGESEADAAPREIEEETGYTSAQYVRTLGTIHSKFYHSVKNVNRFAHFKIAYLELLNDNRIDTAQEEKDLHDVVWLTKEEVKNFLNREDMKLGWSLFASSISSTSQPQAITESGILVNSGKFTGELSEDSQKLITTMSGGMWVEKFKLRDWVFSRQRYWGEPFPIVWVSKESYERITTLKKTAVTEALPDKPVMRIRDGKEQYAVPIPAKYLPVKLPSVKSFAPAGDGKSALATATAWVNVEFNIKTGATRPAKKTKLAQATSRIIRPTDWVAATRETDTMPNWAGSSWYYLRYADTKNKKHLADSHALSYWTPVDWYNGGMEHTTLHLLYSRFWHKFLYDIKVVPTAEPYTKRTSHGLILGEGGVKMSKSLGNVVNPDDVVRVHGADTLRIYEMFMGPFDQHVAWSTDSIVGSRRFIERVWKAADKVNKDAKFINKDLDSVLHKTIKKVSEDIEAMNFNTAISAMMIFISAVEKAELIGIHQYKTFLRILAPFAPHVTEELWAQLKQKGSIHKAPWPEFDPAKMISDTVTIVIQINGKVRATLDAPANITEGEARAKALAHPDVTKRMAEGGISEPKKVIYIPGKLVNIVM